MQKKILTSAVLLSIGGFASSANADLASGTLGLDVQGNLAPACLYGGTYPSCTYGAFDTADAGSFFTMDGNPGGSIDGNDAIPLMLDGSVQAFNGTPISLGSAYVGDNTGPIATWDFFGNLGTNTHGGITANTGDTLVDMTNWAVNWGEVASINMGSGGNSAVLACAGGTCEAGESFTLDYAAVVPTGDPSGFGGAAYTVHLQGLVVEVSAVPVPAAVWLFGSGLLGLVGVARRRKAA